MTEDEARRWVAETYGPTALAAVQRFVGDVIAENGRQNLVAPSTIATIWARHVVDSAQLLSLAPAVGSWLDIGTGAGFPGMVVAILRPAPTILVEPRRGRAEFLRASADRLGLSHVTVLQDRVENVSVHASVISARAVAPIEKLLQAAASCGTKATRWLLPRGASGAAELAAVAPRWDGVFHMKQSLTDPSSRVVVIDGPSPR